ncbi:N-acetylmuramoyl-L-alanine amidase [Actinoallomurus vinaceus]|uniref:N-acetylmuramoyl-L-alanine amidase n=1 Tax=Actinoallomurus vinaceus TaxID=1080074 RepID=A0ABP8UNH5_9ACTN
MLVPRIAAAAVVLASLGAGPAFAEQRASAPPARQQAFATAAKEYKVPENVLLAVSYLESRWDTNRGLPSTTGGYGPMHLVEVTPATGAVEKPTGEDYAAARTPHRTVAAKVRQTLPDAAKLTGDDAKTLRTDPAANIRGGAALLAHYQRDLHKSLAADPTAWYAAVTKYGGSTWFADQVFSVIRSGMSRTTDDGQKVTLAASPKVTTPKSVRTRAADDETDCPADLGCEWLPAPYQQLDPNDPTKYGNYDKADRPAKQKIDFIVIHDTEASYDSSVKSVQDPTYLGWHYTIRSNDGHVAQHVRVKDVGHHAGNWYYNAKSIGIEHEGYVANGAWYTEAMYRSSAELVRYLADLYSIPMDRAHILGHDNVPARVMGTVNQMHQDPGPYWDWAHYFDLMGRPLTGSADLGARVMIRPDYDTNVVPYTGCDKAGSGNPCPAHGGGSVMLRTEPRDDAPLVKDIGVHPTTGGAATMDIYDHSARASTGQTYALADRQGDWTAIWYLGQKAWFYNPASKPTAVGVHGSVVTPKPGLDSVPLYGMAQPEDAAFPAGVTPPSDRTVSPMGYVFGAGQKYAVVGYEESEYFHAVTYDPAQHIVVHGDQTYYLIQFGHRAYFVKYEDVVPVTS